MNPNLVRYFEIWKFIQKASSCTQQQKPNVYMTAVHKIHIKYCENIYSVKMVTSFLPLLNIWKVFDTNFSVFTTNQKQTSHQNTTDTHINIIRAWNIHVINFCCLFYFHFYCFLTGGCHCHLLFILFCVPAFLAVIRLIWFIYNICYYFGNKFGWAGSWKASLNHLLILYTILYTLRFRVSFFLHLLLLTSSFWFSVENIPMLLDKWI